MQTKNEFDSFLVNVGNRIREAETHFKNRARAAETAGVSKSTFQRWEKGESDPSFSGLARISAETGVSLDWIASGKGDKYGRAAARPSGQAPIPTATMDLDLLTEIADGIAKIYADADIAISPARLTRTAGALYCQLAAAYADAAEQRIGIKVLLQQLRFELVRETKRGG